MLKNHHADFPEKIMRILAIIVIQMPIIALEGLAERNATKLISITNEHVD